MNFANLLRSTLDQKGLPVAQQLVVDQCLLNTCEDHRFSVRAQDDNGDQTQRCTSWQPIGFAVFCDSAMTRFTHSSVKNTTAVRQTADKLKRESSLQRTCPSTFPSSFDPFVKSLLRFFSSDFYPSTYVSVVSM